MSSDPDMIELQRRYREIMRLRKLIREEAHKWYLHHTDPEKKQYWHDFAEKANGEPDNE